jgi:hypothetical protein
MARMKKSFQSVAGVAVVAASTLCCCVLATPPIVFSGAVNLRDHLILEKPMAFAIDSARPRGSVKKLQLPRAGNRGLLQWGDCDQNMTLVGSSCVCSSSFYSSSAITPFVMDGIPNFCDGVDAARNLAMSCVAGSSACYVTASRTYSPPDFGPTSNILLANAFPPDGPYITGTFVNGVHYPAWVMVDLSTSQYVGGFSFRAVEGVDWATTEHYHTLDAWIGDNDTSFDAEGNTRCYQLTNREDTQMLFTFLNGVWRNPSYTFSANCMGRGRYFFITSPLTGFYATKPSAPVYRMTKLTVYPPSCTVMPGSPCLPCPTEKTSNPGALSVDDCFVNHGIEINQTINSVDLNYTQGEFTGAVPSYMDLISYAEDQEVFLENCPAGYYCLSDTTVPVACPAGTYRDVPGAEQASDCFACPKGYYCPIGSPFPISCPAGTYRGTPGATQPSGCTPCKTGNYCPLNSVDPVNCTVGTYRDTTGAATPNDCLVCPAGDFCGLATTTPSVCAAGTYNDNAGGITQDDCLSCLIGHYCPAGSVTPTECPAGTYRATTGATNIAQCVVCPAGKYCPVATSTPVSCDAGTFISSTGGESQADCSDCPTGHYCPLSSVTPTDCPSGTFLGSTLGTKLDECAPCTEGYFCLAATTTPAECPAGTYRDILGATQSGDCFTCPSGQFCPTAAVTPTSCLPGTYRATVGGVEIQDCLACPVAHYCPFATTTPMTCPAGTYLGSTGGVDRSSCVTCPTGSYCVETSTAPTQCPAGTFRTAVGATALENCAACPSGQYCPAGTTTPTSCPAGTYLNATNGLSSADCVACPAGQYCLVRSTVPTACDAGSYRGTPGAQNQQQCTVCPTGNYCPEGSVDPTNCSAGTYRTATGALKVEDCLACTAGYYCPLAATTPTACQAGSFRQYASAAAQSDCTTCPVGAYCPSASVTPTMCGPGRHRDTPGATHMSNCLLCLPGTYSLDVGRSSNCPACSANYYCRTSTLKEACPMHTTSATGSYSRLNCRCDPGYSCAYYKQIQAIVTLNATLYDFNNDVKGVRTAFLAAMAAAANVTSDHVTINGVMARTSGALTGRRLFSVGEQSISEEFAALPKSTAEEALRSAQGKGGAMRGLLSVSGKVKDGSSTGIRVFASVAGSGRLHHLEKHLAEKHNDTLLISHRWEQANKVHATKDI